MSRTTTTREPDHANQQRAKLTWWLLAWTYSAFPGDYLAPSVASSVAAAAVAGAAWGVAYAMADAVELARRPAPIRWYEPHLRWMRILGKGGRSGRAAPVCARWPPRSR
jgi:hypothetical protein